MPRSYQATPAGSASGSRQKHDGHDRQRTYERDTDQSDTDVRTYRTERPLTTQRCRPAIILRLGAAIRRSAIRSTSGPRGPAWRRPRLSPDRPGPIRFHWRITTPSRTGSTSKPQWDRAGRDVGHLPHPPSARFDLDDRAGRRPLPRCSLRLTPRIGRRPPVRSHHRATGRPATHPCTAGRLMSQTARHARSGDAATPLVDLHCRAVAIAHRRHPPR